MKENNLVVLKKMAILVSFGDKIHFASVFTPLRHRHPAGHTVSLTSQTVGADELW